jgi:hypothetical protein
MAWLNFFGSYSAGEKKARAVNADEGLGDGRQGSAGKGQA